MRAARVLSALSLLQMGGQQENGYTNKVELGKQQGGGTGSVFTGPVKSGVGDSNEFDRGGGMRLNIDKLLAEVRVRESVCGGLCTCVDLFCVWRWWVDDVPS